MLLRREFRWAACAVIAVAALLTFAPGARAATPTLASSTAQPLLAGEALDVSGTGFETGGPAYFFLDDDDSGGYFAHLTANGSGNIAGAIGLPPVLADGAHVLDVCRPTFADPQCPDTNVARIPLQIGALPEATTTTELTIPPVVLPHVPDVPDITPTTHSRVTTTTTAAVTTTTTLVLPTVVAIEAPSTTTPSLALAPVEVPPPALGVYEPAAHAHAIVDLQIAVFALLGLAGLAPVGATGAVIVSGRRSGGVASAKVKHYKAVDGEGGRGDQSGTWRLPGTVTIDRLSASLPARVAPGSPLLARVLTDGSYLRAIFGSASALLPFVGVALGLAAVANVHGAAMPPALGFMILLPVLGVLDALAGMLAVVAFTGGVAVAGGIVGADSVRILLGFAALCFAAALIASAARPLRRPPAHSAMDRWDRMADFVIASLVGAWAVQKMVGALPGLSGTNLKIASDANVIALSVLAAMVVRMLAESITANWYPIRLSEVQAVALPSPGHGQRLAATALRTAVFLFVAVAFIGARWQWIVGGLLFALPQVLTIYEDRFPHSDWLYRRLPRGIVKTVLMLIVGAVVASLVFNGGGNKSDIIANAFVILSLPGLVLSGLDLVGRDGPARELGWIERIAGVGVLLLGLWLVLVR